MLEDQYNPYRRLTDHAAWHAMSTAINDLVANKDIVEMTAHEFIIGYLLAELWKQSLIDRLLKPKDNLEIPGHWDVIDKDGTKIKEVAPGGEILWQWDPSKDAPMKKVSSGDRKRYNHLKRHPAWKIINNSIKSLVKYGEFTEKIPRHCIIGYIIQELAKQDIFKI